MKKQQRYIKSLVIYMVFILCVFFYYKWDEIERTNNKVYLLENLSKRGESMESSEEVDIIKEFELNPEYSICKKDEEILFIAFVVVVSL